MPWNAFEGKYIEYKSEKGKEYIDKMRSNLGDMIDDLKNLVNGKKQLTMEPKFISSTDNYEKRMMYSKRDCSKVTTSNDANEIIQNLFNSFL